MTHERGGSGDAARRPRAEWLLPEVHARLSRTGPPTLGRLWEALRLRFAQDWAAYCHVHGGDEEPDWDDFPYAGPAALARPLEDLALPYAGMGTHRGGTVRGAAPEGAPPRHRRERGHNTAGAAPPPAERQPPAAERHAEPGNGAEEQPAGRPALASPRGTRAARYRRPPVPPPALPFAELADPGHVAQGEQEAVVAGKGPARRARPPVRAGRPGKERAPEVAQQLRLFDDPQAEDG
jgi:hypothetical protein